MYAKNMRSNAKREIQTERVRHYAGGNLQPAWYRASTAE